MLHRAVFPKRLEKLLKATGQPNLLDALNTLRRSRSSRLWARQVEAGGRPGRAGPGRPARIASAEALTCSFMRDVQEVRAGRLDGFGRLSRRAYSGSACGSISRIGRSQWLSVSSHRRFSSRWRVALSGNRARSTSTRRATAAGLVKVTTIR